MDMKHLSFLRKEGRTTGLGEGVIGKENVGRGEMRAGTEIENRERHCPDSMAADSFSTCLGYCLALLVSARETTET